MPPLNYVLLTISADTSSPVVAAQSAELDPSTSESNAVAVDTLFYHQTASVGSSSYEFDHVRDVDAGLVDDDLLELLADRDADAI